MSALSSLFLVQGTQAVMQYTLALLANLFYNRQSRLKVLRFLRVDEDEVIQRIRLLEKLPSQIVLTVSLRQEEVESAAIVLQNVVVWASRLRFPEVVIFVLARESEKACHTIHQKVHDLCSDPNQ